MWLWLGPKLGLEWNLSKKAANQPAWLPFAVFRLPSAPVSLSVNLSARATLLLKGHVHIYLEPYLTLPNVPTGKV